MVRFHCCQRRGASIAFVSLNRQKSDKLVLQLIDNVHAAITAPLIILAAFISYMHCYGIQKQFRITDCTTDVECLHLSTLKSGMKIKVLEYPYVCGAIDRLCQNLP